MKILRLFGILLLGLLSCGNILAQDRNNEDEVIKLDPQLSRFNSVPGDVIVKFADETNLQLNVQRGQLATGIPNVDAVLRQYNVRNIEKLCPLEQPKERGSRRSTPSYNGPDVPDYDLSRLCIVQIYDSIRTSELIQALNNLEEVEFAEPNYVVYALENKDNSLPVETVCTPSLRPEPAVSFQNETPYTTSLHPETRTTTTPNDPMYAQQWGLSAVQLPQLWAVDTAYAADGSDRPIIAILDTGVDPEHPDLAANIWHNPNEIANGYDDDGNGFVDDTIGWDFVNQTAAMHDFNSHGTHCAGIAAAVGNNGIGICGANPNALIMPITVMQSNGTGDAATIVRGINYAKNNGADIISMSFGTYSNSLAMEQALGQAYQNAVLVAAAGNDGLGMLGCCYTCMDMFPAAFTFVLGVQATKQFPIDLCEYRTCWSNFDCTGPNYSDPLIHSEEQLYNYELSAPGAGIISTVPHGGYRNYNGTSMATPLVAGGISALIHAKEYPSKEMLFGDLINTTPEFYHVNFYAAYQVEEAPAQLQFVTYTVSDTALGDGDNRFDAGETIDFYPTIRTTWGHADSIVYWLEFSEFEDTTTVQFLNNHQYFGWPLSAYAKSRAANPIRMHIDSNVVDGRYINLVLKATCPNAQNTLVFPFTIQVENGVAIGGMIMHDITLYPNVYYIVTSNLAIPDGVTLTILPGAKLKFKDNTGLSMSAGSHLIAEGTCDSLIEFSVANLSQGYINSFTVSGPIKYAIVRDFVPTTGVGFPGVEFENSIIEYIRGTNFFSHNIFKQSNILYNTTTTNKNANYNIYRHSNIIDNSLGDWYAPWHSAYSKMYNSNTYGQITACSNATSPLVLTTTEPSYFGSSIETIARKNIIDLASGTSYGYFDLSNMLTKPDSLAHGIVWKVLCNGYDAQDEFDSIVPLGIGEHRFDVYFNRPMDVSIEPMISMGVRPPYTQTAIDENGSWSADSLIYTCYVELKTTNCNDGLNRIYVANAKDNEHFEIPIENMRFNVQVSSAGSMSANFMATPGIGKVDLEWNNNDVDFDDFLGYNMYRFRYDSLLTNRHYVSNYGYVYDTIWGPTDTLLLNNMLIQDTLFTDFNVTPGERYYYFYKVLRTNMSESEPSKVVTTIPLSAILGDANGNFSVDITDVVTTINYITGQNPQPFLYDAADVNSDGVINILDIVSIINLIMHPGSTPSRGSCATATYTVENGVLYIDSPVELAGVQLLLNMNTGNQVTPTSVLDGFERISDWVDNDTYMLMTFSMVGRTIPAGRFALCTIGDAEVEEFILADPTGCNVVTMNVTEPTGIVEADMQIQMLSPYPNPFQNSVTIPYVVGSESLNDIQFVMTDIIGRIIDYVEIGSQVRGQYTYEWSPKVALSNGVYFVQMRANGLSVQTSKVVLNK